MKYAIPKTRSNRIRFPKYTEFEEEEEEDSSWLTTEDCQFGC